jgi:hypothetical protein
MAPDHCVLKGVTAMANDIFIGPKKQPVEVIVIPDAEAEVINPALEDALDFLASDKTRQWFMQHVKNEMMEPLPDPGPVMGPAPKEKEVDRDGIEEFLDFLREHASDPELTGEERAKIEEEMRILQEALNRVDGANVGPPPEPVPEPPAPFNDGDFDPVGEPLEVGMLDPVDGGGGGGGQNPDIGPLDEN